MVPVIRIKTAEEGIEHCNTNNLALQVSLRLTQLLQQLAESGRAAVLSSAGMQPLSGPDGDRADRLCLQGCLFTTDINSKGLPSWLTVCVQTRHSLGCCCCRGLEVLRRHVHRDGADQRSPCTGPRPLLYALLRAACLCSPGTGWLTGSCAAAFQGFRDSGIGSQVSARVQGFCKHLLSRPRQDQPCAL